MAGPGNYTDDSAVSALLAAVPGQKKSTWPMLETIASRGIDGFCERFFYSLTGTIKYFDVSGDPSSATVIRTWLSKLDFYGATTIKIATKENADPAVTGDWITLTGDGITPPSDFYLEPGNEVYVGKAGDVNVKPFNRIELPAAPPATSSTFQNGFKVGKRTLAVQPVGWGWPAIPDEIAYIAAKVVVRMFKAQPTGFTGATGSPDTAAGAIVKYLDIDDMSTLFRYKRYSVG